MAERTACDRLTPAHGDADGRAVLDVEMLTEAPDLRIGDLWEAVQDHVIAEAELVGTDARG